MFDERSLGLGDISLIGDFLIFEDRSLGFLIPVDFTPSYSLLPEDLPTFFEDRFLITIDDATRVGLSNLKSISTFFAGFLIVEALLNFCSFGDAKTAGSSG